MRTFFLVLFLLILLLVGSVFGLVWAALDDTPLVNAQSHSQVQDADSVNKLLSVIRNSLRRRQYVQNIAINQTQLDSLMGFAARAKRDFSGNVDLSTQMAKVEASYRLPDNPFGHYLNLTAEVLPGEGLQLGQVKLGGIHIPGDWLISLSAFALNWYTGSDLGDQSLRQVDRIILFDNSAVVVLRPLQDILAHLEALKDQLELGQENEPLKVRTAYYLKYLSELPETNVLTKQSLAIYIGKLFSEVEAISQAGNANEENEAAILALAIFAGNHRFAAFVGDVQPVDGELARPTRPAVLANRTDLSQHFIYSAAIKILSEQGISAAIGEFKELMDRGSGGSGYSFVDLAADFAGIEFAARATDPDFAPTFQQRLAGVAQEGSFFPSVADLPEGLSKQQFQQQFSRVDSPQYNQLVDRIKRRVANLPAYQSVRL